MAIELNTSKENVLMEDSYVGLTMSECHVRINGHRKCFKGNGNREFLEFKKSALSWHCHEEHPDNFDLRIFKLGFIRSCK